MATSGLGSGSHVSGELFQMMAGIKLTHVPYRNNYIPDLLGGQVPLAVSPMPQVIEFVKDGRLRALGVTPATRSQMLPDVPSIGEVVKGCDASGWFGLCAPKGTPASVEGAKRAVALLRPMIPLLEADPTQASARRIIDVFRVALSGAGESTELDDLDRWLKDHPAPEP